MLHSSSSSSCYNSHPPAEVTISLTIITMPSMTLPLYSSSKRKGPSILKWFLMDHGIIQARRDLKRPLVHAPAPSRISCEIQLGCSGLCPVRSWKPSRTETGQPPWATCGPAWLASLRLKKLLPTTSVNFPHFNWCLLSLGLPPCIAGKSLEWHQFYSFSEKKGNYSIYLELWYLSVYAKYILLFDLNYCFRFLTLLTTFVKNSNIINQIWSEK